MNVSIKYLKLTLIVFTFIAFSATYALAQVPSVSDIKKQAEQKIDEVSGELGLDGPPTVNDVKNQADELIQQKGQELGLFPKKEENNEGPQGPSNSNGGPEFPDVEDIFEEANEKINGSTGGNDPFEEINEQFDTPTEEAFKASEPSDRGPFPFFDEKLLTPQVGTNNGSKAVDQALDIVFENTLPNVAAVTGQANDAVQKSFESLGFSTNASSAKPTTSVQTNSANTNVAQGIGAAGAGAGAAGNINLNLDHATGASQQALQQTQFIFNNTSN